MPEIEGAIEQLVKTLTTYASGKTRALWICHLLDLLQAETANDPEHKACLQAIREYLEAQLQEDDYLVILTPLPDGSTTPSDFPTPPWPIPGPPKPPCCDD
jgi:hypothetical protein